MKNIKQIKKKEIVENLSFWQKLLNESEDLFDIEDSMPICSAKDLIKNDFNKYNSGIICTEFIPFSRSNFKISDEDMQKVQALYAKNINLRFMVYFLADFQSGNISLKNAMDYIESEEDFLEYTDPNSHLWIENDFDIDFAAKFKTYNEWTNFIINFQKEKLKNKLAKIDDIPYCYFQDNIKVNKNNTPYILTVWRS